MKKKNEQKQTRFIIYYWLYYITAFKNYVTRIEIPTFFHDSKNRQVKGDYIITDQGWLQSFVNETELGLRLEVKSLHKVFLGFFPVSQLSLNQGHVVENLCKETSCCIR